MVRPEEEGLVLDERAANRATPFVAAQHWTFDAGPVEEEVVGVQLFVLEVVIDRAVELVRATLGDELEVAAAVAPRSGVVEAGLQLDFFERLRRWRDVPRQRAATLFDCAPVAVDAAVAAEQVGDINAVVNETVVSGARAVDAGRDGSVVIREQFADVSGHPLLDHQQLSEVPRGGRQPFEFLAIQRPDCSGRVGRDHFLVAGHLDALADIAYLKLDIDRRQLGCGHGNFIPHEPFETTRLEIEAVDSSGQEARLPFPCGIGSDNTLLPCLHFSQCDSRIRERGTGWIADASGQASVSSRLRQDRRDSQCEE